MCTTKAKHFDLKFGTDGWQVRFLDTHFKPIQTSILTISTTGISRRNHADEWTTLNIPLTKFGAKRLVRKFLAGKIRNKPTQNTQPTYRYPCWNDPIKWTLENTSCLQKHGHQFVVHNRSCETETKCSNVSHLCCAARMFRVCCSSRWRFWDLGGYDR